VPKGSEKHTQNLFLHKLQGKRPKQTWVEVGR